MATSARTKNTAAWLSAFAALAAAITGGIALYLSNQPKGPSQLGGQIESATALVAPAGSGALVTVRAPVTLEGFTNEKATLQWSLDYASSGLPVENRDLVLQTGAELTPQAATDTAEASFQLPVLTPTGTRFIIHLRLIGPNGTVLSESDTQPFTV
jgi:hypothetical protein